MKPSLESCSNAFRCNEEALFQIFKQSLLANLNETYIDDVVVNNKYVRPKPIFRSKMLDYNSSFDLPQKDDFSFLKKDMNTLVKEVKKITKHMQDDDEEGEKKLNWIFAGMVIDRLCFFTFSILTFILTSTLLLSSKNFFKFQ